MMLSGIMSITPQQLDRNWSKQFSTFYVVFVRLPNGYLSHLEYEKHAAINYHCHVDHTIISHKTIIGSASCMYIGLSQTDNKINLIKNQNISKVLYYRIVIISVIYKLW